MSGRDDALVRALPLGDQWQVYGSDAMRGIQIEGLKLDADDFGPRQMSGNLKRDPGVAWGDLQAATPLEVEIGGSLLWGGRQKESPTSEVNRQIAISGEGWQYHTDDDLYRRQYVITDLGRWQDYRSNPQADLTAATAVGVTSQDSGGVTLTIPANQTLVVSKLGGGAFIDLGPDYPTGGRILIDYTTATTGAGITAYAQWATTIAGLASGASLTISALNGTFGTASLTWVGAFRYIGIFLTPNVGANQTPTTDAWFKASSIKVFGSTAWESGNASILKASDVIRDALTHAPLLSSDQSQIASTSFNIPDFAMTDFQSPRSVALAANAYHAYQLRINADRRPEYRPRPVEPLLTAVGGTFEDASAGSLDQVYNRCVGQATGPDGIQIISAQVGSGTIPDRRGYYRTNGLNTNMSLTQTALDQMTTTFISSHGRMPFKGTYTASGWDAVAFTVGGARVPAWELLRYVGEMIHFPNQTDPDTGAKGRDGRISAVSYDHDSRTSSVSIDSQRSNFEALLARLQVVTGRVA